MHVDSEVRFKKSTLMIRLLRISRLPRTFSTAWPILDIITVYDGRRAGPVPGNPGGVAFSSFRRSRAQGQWIFWTISTGSLYQPKTWIQLSTGLKRRLSRCLERDVKCSSNLAIPTGPFGCSKATSWPISPARVCCAIRAPLTTA